MFDSGCRRDVDNTPSYVNSLEKVPASLNEVKCSSL